LARFLGVTVDKLVDAMDQRVRQTFVYGFVAPRQVFDY
jgi:hypothetical protein